MFSIVLRIINTFVGQFRTMRNGYFDRSGNCFKYLLVRESFLKSILTELFNSKESEVSDEQEEIEGGDGERHEGGIKLFADNIVNGEEYYEEIVGKNSKGQ